MAKEKARTYAVKTDEIRRLMDEKNISQAGLARATGMSSRGIQNILQKVNDPLEDNIVNIAKVLCVKWRSLLEDDEGQPENVAPGGEIPIQTTIDFVLNLARLNGITHEQAYSGLIRKITESVPVADVIRITILREDQ